MIINDLIVVVSSETTNEEEIRFENASSEEEEDSSWEVRASPTLHIKTYNNAFIGYFELATTEPQLGQDAGVHLGQRGAACCDCY